MPSTEASIRQPRVEELPGSPQVFDGFTASPVTFTLLGSLTTMNLSLATPVISASWSVSLPQPLPPSDRWRRSVRTRTACSPDR